MWQIALILQELVVSIGMYQTLISSSVLPRLTSNFESISPTTYNCRTKCNKNWYGRVYLKQTLCVNPTSTCWKTTHWCQLYSSKNQTFKKFNRSWIIRVTEPGEEVIKGKGVQGTVEEENIYVSCGLGDKTKHKEKFVKITDQIFG